jgi:NAD(P)H-hydrate epimerase
MEILTAAEMGAVDRRTVELGVPVSQLMENAGGAVARFCLRQYPGARRVVVLCGKGNNGGDGLVAARVLAEAGIGVEVLLLGRADEVKGEAAGAQARLRDEAPGVVVREVVDEGSIPMIASRAWGTQGGGADLILDAVVGTGFKPPLRGVAAALRELVAKASVPVVAVDLPSGWDADSIEQKADAAYRADAVVTFTRPKLAHVFGHLTETTFGPVVVAEIGTPDGVVDSVCSDPTHRDGTAMNRAPSSDSPRLWWTGTAKAIAEAPRGVNANKGKYGHVLVVGGSYGTAGAPSMASLAALRAGAGLVTAAVPKSVLALVAGVAPELMLAPLQEGVEGAASLENLSGGGLEAPIKQKRISVVAVGPGLSTKGEASEFARELVAKVKLPMVIDADALNAFDGKAELLNGAGRVMVLTPHPGEMARLAGMTVADVEKDRVGLARRFATEHQLTLVLKGWRTLVAHPDGRVAVNTTGNPAMAKGGSGDILTGICAAMLAQYAGSGKAEDVARAVEAAVFLHGLAGDFAALKMDEHTVLATDTVACLSDAFRCRVKDGDGLTWICGMHERTA